MYDKCDVCLNRRTIVSENGYHTICSLSSKKATDCLMCKKSYFMLDRFKVDDLIDSTMKGNKKCTQE